MQTIDHQIGCPSCGSLQIEPFLKLPALPICTNLIWSKADEAARVPRAQLELAICHRCNLIYNHRFDPAKVEYSGSYDNSLESSPRFERYMCELASELVDRHQLQGKDVIEIGCGQGHFLAALCRLGQCRCVGYDPAYAADSGASIDAAEGKFTIHARLFTARDAQKGVDFVCSRHVLEHIPRPLEMLRNLRDGMSRRHNTALYFEVPNMLDTLRRVNIWDLIYEHCLYFEPTSLANLFRMAGFEPVHLQERFEGQYLSIEACPVPAHRMPTLQTTDGTTRSLVARFKKSYEQKMRYWQQRLIQARQTGKQAVLWGAGAKGVTFLNLLQIETDLLPFAIDLNPRKQGHYVAGTAQQIAAPSHLAQHPPDLVLLTNPNYEQEVSQILRSMGIKSELLVA